jgi:hypothetical protein
MSCSEDEILLCRSGCVTPPLSPSKTVSTEGWFSPRTPASPRKIRSCLFTQELDNDACSPFFTPPGSPTKSRPTLHHGALTDSEILHAPNEFNSLQPNNELPRKPCVFACTSRSCSPCSSTFTPVYTPSSPHIDENPCENPVLPTPDIKALHVDNDLPVLRKSVHRSMSDGLSTQSVCEGSPMLFDQEMMAANAKAPTLLTLSQRLDRFRLRSFSSPLRSSQWAARGGLVTSPRKGQACIPDRYIAQRRPPTVTRQSFELNKPAERLDAHKIGRGGRSNADPFNHRLRRSERLNDELRGLREAHSLLMGRASVQRRNANLASRLSSSILASRQISGGAVWNVGGPSAVSDTVIGVSTGRGGMLGPGTNAPLYTSSFLERADPEAELDAYERRLALAFDVDQSERILQHSLSPLTIQSTEHCDSPVYAKHTWRDCAWIKDGISSRLSMMLPAFTYTSC